MASFLFLLPQLQRRCMAATSHLHAISSLPNLHSPPLPSHHPNPSLPTNLANESFFPFTVYPTFPHSSHLHPVSLLGATKDPLIGAQREPNFGLSFAPFSNLDLIPFSEALGLDIQKDEQIVIRADSVKKKRKRKMNKHKLKKLRKKLRRKT